MEYRSSAETLDGINLDVSMALPPDRAMMTRSSAEAVYGISLDVNTALPTVNAMEACSSTEPMDGIGLDVNRNADTAHDKVSIKCRGRYRIKVKGAACHGHACCGGT